MTFEGMEDSDDQGRHGRLLGGLPGASRLTLAQREAIESDEPLLCVVAGAGAGKTRVLTLRVARRVRDGSIDADRTLVTTFSRKAADELRTRLWSLGRVRREGRAPSTAPRSACCASTESCEAARRPSSCPTAAGCWPR